MIVPSQRSSGVRRRERHVSYVSRLCLGKVAVHGSGFLNFQLVVGACPVKTELGRPKKKRVCKLHLKIGPGQCKAMQGSGCPNAQVVVPACPCV
eukprot:623221-Pelagomonas_calceolata.AAC.1